MFGNKRDDLDYVGFYTKTGDTHSNKNENNIIPNFIWIIVGIVLIFFVIRELFIMFTVGVFMNEASKMNDQIIKTTNEFQKEITEGSQKANESMQRLRSYNPPPQNIEKQPRSKEEIKRDIKIEMH